MPGMTNGQYLVTLGQGVGVRPLLVAGNLTRANNAADTTSSGNEHRQTRAPSYFGADLSEVWFVVATWWLDLGAGGKETAVGNAVPWSAALEYNGVSIAARNATLAAPYSIPDGTSALLGPWYPSDFGLTKFTKSDQFFMRTDVSVTIGQKIPRSGQYLSEAPAYRLTSAAGASQLTDAGALVGANNGNGPTPIMVVGRSIGKTVAIIEVGDSLGEGNGDTSQYPNASVSGGFIQRGAWGASKTAIAQLGRQGGQLSRLFNGSDGVQRALLWRYATHVIIEFGANDLFGPSSPVATFEANLTALVAQMKAAGVKYVLVNTVAPRTQSTNKFTDAAGQSPQVNWDPVAFSGAANSYIAGLTAGNDGYFDVNASWGDSGGNSKWVTTGAAFYPIASPTDGAAGTITAGTGTITAATNSTAVAGSGTNFTAFAVGNFLYQGAAGTTYLGRIASITNDLALVLEANALAAVSGGAWSNVTAQLGTHPTPTLYAAAGTALATVVAAFVTY